MEKIKDLQDLKYRKLYIRNEIFRKEQKIKQQLKGLQKGLTAPSFKNEITRGILDNPSLVINVAQITYKLVKNWKKRRNRKRTK